MLETIGNGSDAIVAPAAKHETLSVRIFRSVTDGSHDEASYASCKKETDNDRKAKQAEGAGLVE